MHSPLVRKMAVYQTYSQILFQTHCTSSGNYRDDELVVLIDEMTGQELTGN